MRETFADELRSLINRHSRENFSDTPDWILAAFIEQSLLAFESAVRKRDHYTGISMVENPESPTPLTNETKEN